MAAWIGRQAVVARRLLRPAEQVQRQVDDRLSRLEAEHRAELADKQQELTDAETSVSDAQRRLDEAEAQETAAKAELAQMSGTRLLRRYLSDRVNSGDYGQSLGMVALAHRDLRDLDDHLRAAANDSEAPTDRVVLFIDDLDRCAPETVVRVLEAVNLLLALPLFVVVVGVDEALLDRSLRSRHPVLLGVARHNGARPRGTAGVAARLPGQDFQLTYQLPPMDADGCAALLRHTAMSTQPVLRPPAVTHEPEPRPVTEPASPAPETGDAGPAMQAQQTGPNAEQRPQPRVPTARALELSPRELDALDTLAPLVTTSPRRAKRFLNVYRIVRARSMVDDGRRSPRDEGALVALLVLVALAVGLPDSAPEILEHTDPGIGADARQLVRSLPRRPDWPG